MKQLMLKNKSHREFKSGDWLRTLGCPESIAQRESEIEYPYKTQVDSPMFFIVEVIRLVPSQRFRTGIGKITAHTILGAG